MMKPVEPIVTADLFVPIHEALDDVLAALEPDEWMLPTACEGWSVRDVVAHLLGGSLGRLIGLRGREDAAVDVSELARWFDLFERLPPPTGPLDQYDVLVAWINDRNAQWVETARSLSVDDLRMGLSISEPLLAQLFASWDPFAPAPISVAWAGEDVSPRWFDVAREYTEKWHHQQHIRDAVEQPGLCDARFMGPVIDTFMRGLPHAYRHKPAPPQTEVLVVIDGPAGGAWTLRFDAGVWVLFAGKSLHSQPRSVVRFDQAVAWRLFTNGLSPVEAVQQMQFDGPRFFAEPILGMTTIMA